MFWWDTWAQTVSFLEGDHKKMILRLPRRVAATKVKETSSTDRQHQPKTIRFKKIGVNYCAVPTYRRAGKCTQSLPEKFREAVHFLDSIQVRDRWNWEHQGRHAMIISFLQRNHRACQSLIQTQENDRRSYFGRVSIEVQVVGKVCCHIPLGPRCSTIHLKFHPPWKISIWISSACFWWVCSFWHWELSNTSRPTDHLCVQSYYS